MPSDETTAELARPPWRVKYTGECATCGTVLEKGVIAVWDRSSRTMNCVSCPERAEVDGSPTPLDPGVAGRSARREHERRVAKREADLKDAWGNRVGGWIKKLSDEPPSTRAWAIGAAGEERLEHALREASGIEVLHDRRVPHSRANIDHIVVAPAGVFVIDAKHYQGQIRIERRGSFFHPTDRLFVGRRDRSSDVDGVKQQVAVVEDVLGASAIHPVPTVTPVLCFIDGHWPLFRAASQFDGVYLESERSVRKLLVGSADYGPGQIDEIARELARLLPPR